MKIFNFKNKKIQYLREEDVYKLFKFFQKPDKLFALCNTNVSFKNAKWDFENLETDTEFLLIDKISANKIFNEFMLYIKEEIEEGIININELSGVCIAIYDITEESSLIIYSDIDNQWRNKILRDLNSHIKGIELEYAFVEIYEMFKLKKYISNDIYSLLEPKVLNKENKK